MTGDRLRFVQGQFPLHFLRDDDLPFDFSIYFHQDPDHLLSLNKIFVPVHVILLQLVVVFIVGLLLLNKLAYVLLSSHFISHPQNDVGLGHFFHRVALLRHVQSSMHENTLEGALVKHLCASNSD